MTKHRIFVTGGAGFIGRHLLNALPGNTIEAFVYDNLLPQVHGEGARCPDFPENVRFVFGDIRDGNALERALRETKPDIVYHLAAETGTGQSRDEITRYCDVNVGGTSRLIEAIRRLENPPSRVVLAGTRAVYGEGAYRDTHGKLVVPPTRTATEMKARRFAPQDSAGQPLHALPTGEETPPAPASVYATTKLTQEYLLNQGFEGTAVEPVVLRFQNVYGPGQSMRNPYTGVLSIFLSQILAGQRLNIYEDGEITRDFVFVQDVVRSLELAGRIQLPRGAVINIGSGRGVTILSVARKLLKILGRREDGLDITGDFRPGDVRYAVADTTLAEALLSWHASTSLDEGLRLLALSTTDTTTA
ncbi:MAG: NAD-dependent epimerase/dehydratase family protein [Pseudomonadota bacterium]|nr:NAD-dependent epimerase/dehydratase family protein [Pseudomonadota bacterium]